jgi:hypothetical protein
MTTTPASHAILYPIAAMMLLVAVITTLMLRERIAEMKSRRIHPQKVATSSLMAQVLQNTHAADNYKNLFEMPVLFYALCLALHASHTTGIAWLVAAWVYVGLRVWHSVIHVTHNRVMLRFQVFAASGTVLLALWIAFAAELLMRA